MQADVATQAWSCAGLSRGEALRQWREWASGTLAPIEVRVPNAGRFSARWASHGLGQLRFVEIGASAQSVIHPGESGSSGGEPTVQLVYSRRGQFKTRTSQEAFVVRPGEFVLLDNRCFYSMEMDSRHEAIDLVMPRAWLERWLPDPEPFIGRPLATGSGWGTPLGAMLETMARNLPVTAMPQALVADQVGSLLSLAAGFPRIANRHRDVLTQRILRLIDQHHADPDLSLDAVAGEIGISKRYVHALLAAAGTSFGAALTRARMERAAGLLADPRRAELPIGDIAWESGFSDPAYFTRLFRRRFGTTPRTWRAERLQ